MPIYLKTRDRKSGPNTKVWCPQVPQVPFKACLRIPLLWLHPARYRHRRTTRGQSDWLNLLCRTLSFPTPIRFIPALSCVPLRSPCVLPLCGENSLDNVSHAFGLIPIIDHLRQEQISEDFISDRKALIRDKLLKNLSSPELRNPFAT